jgi:fumarate reductase (CoM/CoB) subunit A
MKNYDPRGELATRDIVARAIYNEIREGRGTQMGGVYLDVTHLPDEVIEEKLETMLLQFLDVDVDIRKEPMEVAPTAHHFVGGIRIDGHGNTTVKNLFAAGEVTGGVHGANRLGGNALADTQVFGKRAGEAAAENALEGELNSNDAFVEAEKERISNLFKGGDVYPFEIKKELEEVMWKNVAIIRNEEGLIAALKRINELKAMLKDMRVPDVISYNNDLLDALEITKMLDVAELVTKSAILRRESRGAHYREDFPETDDNWKKSIVFNKSGRIRFIER